MATRRYGLSRGQDEFAVTEATGAATSSDNVEVTVDLAVSLTQSEVLIIMEHLKNWMLKNASGQLKGGS